jgi:hypothetical protein
LKMGSWGTGPFDHDDAGDMIAGLMRPLKKVVERKSNRSVRYNYQAARAAIQVLLVAYGTDILGGPCLEDATTALKRMLSDEEWLNGWRNPFDIAAQLRSEIRQVRRVQTYWATRQTARDRLIARTIKRGRSGRSLTTSGVRGVRKTKGRGMKGVKK